ncbi:D-aminoacyl-tRNA deacylase [Corynebacterium macclintockiae]|uniref:D-aminoacyl-tRNA deacylase n=1 Tax=Corynebacterium macclintockiae TaxID=2913501 RepID=UPI003EC0F972
MKAVVSTVSSAEVTVDGEVVGAVQGPALLALVGIGVDDVTNNESVEKMARKIAELRLLPADGEAWDSPRNHSVEEIGGQVLLVSQFTLMGETKKGRRPSWANAAPGEAAQPIFDRIAELLRKRGIVVETGRFGAMMKVSSANEGPFTVLIET